MKADLLSRQAHGLADTSDERMVVIAATRAQFIDARIMVFTTCAANAQRALQGIALS